MKTLITLIITLFIKPLSAQIDFIHQVNGNSVFLKVTLKGQYYEAYKWEFGDGKSLIEIGRDTVTHNYDSFKNYFVCVYGIPMPVSPADSMCKIIPITTTLTSETNLIRPSVSYDSDIKNILLNKLPLHSVIQIFDLQGRIHFNSICNNDYLFLDISEWVKGLYFVTIQNGNELTKCKIQKE